MSRISNYDFKSLNSRLYSVVCMFKSHINPTCNKLLCDEDIKSDPVIDAKNDYLTSLLEYNEYKRFYKLTEQIVDALFLKLIKNKVDNNFETAEDAIRFLSLFISRTHARNFYFNVDISSHSMPNNLYAETNYDKSFGKIWTFILRTISYNLRVIINNRDTATIDDFHKLFLPLLFKPEEGKDNMLYSTIITFDMYVLKHLNLL